MKDSDLMLFGKHKGTPIGEVPASYLIWFAEQDWSSKWPELEQYVNDHWKQIEAEAQEDDARSVAETPYNWR